MNYCLNLKDSRDAIELLYQNVILKNFSNYEKFWSQFIGQNRKSQQTMIEAYKYEFPRKISSDEKRKILSIYEKLQMFHYSLFCHLAGAHYQFNELQKTLPTQGKKEKHFQHWENFEVGYIHLGSVFYMLECVWNLVLKLNRYPNRYRHLEAYLILKKKDNLLSRLEALKNNIKNRRDQAIHYGRILSITIAGEVHVPLKVDRELLWSDKNVINDWIRTDTILNEDIIKTEKLINSLHELLFAEYEHFIKEKAIKIICEY